MPIPSRSFLWGPLVVILLFSTLPALSFSYGTNITQDITNQTTWNEEGSPYFLLSGISVSAPLNIVGATVYGNGNWITSSDYGQNYFLLSDSTLHQLSFGGLGAASSSSFEGGYIDSQLSGTFSATSCTFNGTVFDGAQIGFSGCKLFSPSFGDSGIIQIVRFESCYVQNLVQNVPMSPFLAEVTISSSDFFWDAIPPNSIGNQLSFVSQTFVVANSTFLVDSRKVTIQDVTWTTAPRSLFRPELSVTGSTFSGFETGLFIYSSGNLTVTHCSFFNNSQYNLAYFDNSGGHGSVMAEWNWWGTDDDQAIPKGIYNVSGPVLYEPFLTTPPS